MDTTSVPDDSTKNVRFESTGETGNRLVREAAMIAEARAELDAGLYVDADEIDAWIDSIGTDHELPPPPTRHR